MTQTPRHFRRALALLCAAALLLASSFLCACDLVVEPYHNPDETTAQGGDDTTNGGDLPQNAKHKNEQIGIPSYCKPTGTPGLYDTGITADNEITMAALFDDVLEIGFWEESVYHYSIFDLADGSLIGQLEISEFGRSGYLADGRHWWLDHEGHFTVYTLRGTADFSADLPFAGENIGPYFGEFDFLQPTGDGTRFLWKREGEPLIHVTDLATGTDRTADTGILGSVAYPFTYGETDDPIILCDSSSQILCELDPDTLALSEIRFGTLDSPNTYRMLEGMFLLNDSERALLYDPRSGNVWTLDLPGGEEEDIMDCRDRVLATQSRQNDAINFYDLTTGQNLGTVSVPFNDPNYWYMFKMADNGRIVFVESRTTGISIKLVKLSELIPGTDTVTDMFPLDHLETKTAQLASTIKSTTGILLYYGSAGNDFNVGDYVALPIESPFTTYYCVKEIASVLSAFPKGMIKEAYEGYYRGIQIYLCGTIYGVDGESLDTAGGVTNESGGYLVIALDGTNHHLSHDLPHELSHVFDRRVSRILQSSHGTNYDTFWASLSPDGAFAYSYLDYESLSDYTAAGETSLDRVWFVRDYGRTFPTEDRATLFEAIFPTKDGGEYDNELTFPHVREKAGVYCSILRLCFTSLSDCGPLPWETGLTLPENPLAGIGRD